jgi:hypothetical protein
VAAEHTSRPRSAYLDYNAEQRVGKGAVGTDVRYRNADEQSDGDSLVVAVGTHPKGVTSCDHPPEWLAGCVAMSGGFLLWESEAPEEDPGVVEVVVPKGKATVPLVYSGPKITGDPRELEMPVTVDDLFAIARDPRVGLTTSRDAIDAGEKLDYWHD